MNMWCRWDVRPDCLRGNDAGLNTSDCGRTEKQMGDVPCGCMWFHGRRENVREAESHGQQAMVVFKKGKARVRSTEGLGNSQRKELEYLETNFPRYRRGG